MITKIKKSHLAKKLTALLVSAAMLYSGAVAFASDPLVSNTTATVSFIDGDLELGGNASGSGMFFNFGQHKLPSTTVSYPAINAKDHILQVEDARYNSGDWQVTVSLSSFADTGVGTLESFDGMITLKGAVLANENPAAGTAGISVPPEIMIAPDTGEKPVMTATDEAPRGIFTATWTDKDVVLKIDGSETSKIGITSYTAALTWTLNIGP